MPESEARCVPMFITEPKEDLRRVGWEVGGRGVGGGGGGGRRKGSAKGWHTLRSSTKACQAPNIKSINAYTLHTPDVARIYTTYTRDVNDGVCFHRHVIQTFILSAATAVNN